MRERIARAAWEANRARAAGIVELAPWEDENEALHADWLAFADAALDALREPTEAMLLRFLYELHANVPEADRPGFARCDFSDEQWARALSAFAAMIDAAKEER